MPKTVEKIADLLEQGRSAFRKENRGEEKRIHQEILELSHLLPAEQEWMDDYYIINFIESRKGVGTSQEMSLLLVSAQGERHLDQFAPIVQHALEQHIQVCRLCQEEYEEGMLSSSNYNYDGIWGYHSWGYHQHLMRICRIAAGGIDDKNPNRRAQ